VSVLVEAVGHRARHGEAVADGSIHRHGGKKSRFCGGFLENCPLHSALCPSLRPLDLGPQRYLPDAKGAPLLAAGFMQTARQWSELGSWLLKHEEIVSAFKPSDANRAFGFGFWNNRAAESKLAREVDVEDTLDKKWPAQSWRNACLCRSAPADLIACIGSYGQRLYLVPS
jgi:hypothetical protein